MGMENLSPNAKRTLRLCLALYFVTMMVYLPVVTHDFLFYDDDEYVFENPIVRRGLTGQGFCWAWTTFTSSHWHPLTWLSHMLDCQLFGLHPGPHHFVNLFLHTANAILLLLVLRRMTGETWRPAVVAALFALHPLQVESVAWIADRKDILCTFFGILALGAYAHYAGQPRPWRYFLVVLCFSLSLLAKPTLVTLPFLLLLLDYWPLRRSGWPRLLLEKVPLATLAVASCAITVVAQRAGLAPDITEPGPLGPRVATAVVRYAGYLARTFWPANLSLYYPDNLETAQVIGSGLLLALVSLLAVVLRRRAPTLLVGWLWFVGTLVPTIGLGVPQDRYTYFPLIGLFLALVWAVPDRLLAGTRARVAGAVAGFVVLAVCAVLTWHQVGFWRNIQTAWEHTIEVTGAPIAHFKLGFVFYRQGQVDEAEDQFRAALALDPNLGLCIMMLGDSLRRQGKLVEADELLTCAVGSVRPKFVYLARNNLGILRYQQGQLEAACMNFREATRRRPDDCEGWFNLATASAEKGETQQAAEAYREGLRLNPDWPKSVDALARALLTVNNPKARCPAEALFRAKQACQATDYQEPQNLGTLADAYAAVGDLPAAVATAKKAKALASR